MLNVIAAAALAAATPADPPPAQPEAAPAMFELRDADTTIYVFGTFHALDTKTQWFNDRVRGAFERSNELVLELVLPEQPKPYRPSPGFHPPSVTPSASFLATTRMAINAGRSQGLQVDNGADMILRYAAEAEGKPVEGLETMQFQLDMFSHMPAPASPAPQFRTAGTSNDRQMQSLSKAMTDMQAAWKRGDQKVFVDMLAQLRAASPETYRMLFTERNDRWADWIRARMRTPGTVFVAVGAGHLAGPDSLLVRLAERGLPSRRVY